MTNLNRDEYETYDDELCEVARAVSGTDDIPNTYRQAIRSTDAELWEKAIQEELDSLEENECWEVVDRPKDRKVVDSRWVFTIKKNADGSTE